MKTKKMSLATIQGKLSRAEMKNYILLLFAILIILQLPGQSKTVKIHGTVMDTSVKTLEIVNLTDDQLSNWQRTKLNVENGTFSTSIQIPFPTEIIIAYRNNIFGKKFIDSDAEILIDSAGEPHIIGSPVQDEYEKEFLPYFQSNDQVFNSLGNLYESIYEKYGDNVPKTAKDSVIALKNKYYHGRATLLEEYIKLHPNSYVATWDIYYFVSMSPTHRYFDFEKLFSSFSPQMQKQPFIIALKEKIKASDYMEVGQIFPKDFFKDYEQMQSKVKNKNQYYLIDFWYSHCSPCVAGFPKLKGIYAQFHGKGFDIISISVDKQKDRKDYLSAIQKNKLVWNHI